MPAYITVDDVRDAGVTVAEADDAAVTASIELWQQILERVTRQWFESRALTIKFDGTDSDAIHTGVPIITVDHLKINSDTDALDTDLFRVYNSRSYPDDRRNPRIKLVQDEAFRNIFTAPLTIGRLKFFKGRQNQELKGTFGFTEEDGSIPLAIQRALTQLVVEKLSPGKEGAGSGGGIVKKEKADVHEITFAVPDLGKRRAGLAGITTNPEVIDIFKLYRAPIGIATQAHFSLT